MLVYFSIELYECLVYSGYEPLIRHDIYKYFLPFCRLLFHSVATCRWIGNIIYMMHTLPRPRIKDKSSCTTETLWGIALVIVCRLWMTAMKQSVLLFTFSSFSSQFQNWYYYTLLHRSNRNWNVARILTQIAQHNHVWSERFISGLVWLKSWSFYCISWFLEK